jgi:hypothetical protein
VDGAHKGVVARCQLADETFLDQPTKRPDGEYGVQIRAFVGAVVGMGPGKFGSTAWDLTVRAVAGRVVYVEARLVRQMDAPCRDEGEAGFLKRLLRPGKRRHANLHVEAN